MHLIAGAASCGRVYKAIAAVLLGIYAHIAAHTVERVLGRRTVHRSLLLQDVAPIHVRAELTRLSTRGSGRRAKRFRSILAETGRNTFGVDTVDATASVGSRTGLQLPRTVEFLVLAVTRRGRQGTLDNAAPDHTRTGLDGPLFHGDQVVDSDRLLLWQKIWSLRGCVTF